MNLEEKIQKSKEILETAIEKFKPNIATTFTGGKDSTTVLSLIREIYGNVPIPVIFVDTGLKFKETYEFIEKLKNRWSLHLIVAKNEDALKQIEPAKDKEKCCYLLKVVPLSRCIKENNFRGLITAIRWDEQEARANEKYLSKREDHWRIQPILHWTEKDIWDYIKSRNIPYNPLYDKGYRSLSCTPCTFPSEEGERAGRAKEKEIIMERLRALGYF
jgi:phosphoadenosine phosphosulfate reductase